MIKLHHLNRSRSHRIFWLLEEIGEDYEVISYERDAKTNLAPPALLKVHPLGKSPMVEMRGRLITESGAITEVLCETFARQMIPQKDTDDYCRHLELMHFAEGSAMIPILLNLYVGRLGEAGAPLHPRIHAELTSHFSYMNDLVRASGHFVLDDLSAADIMLSFPAEIAVERMGRADEFPELARYLKQIKARPAYRRAIEKGNN